MKIKKGKFFISPSDLNNFVACKYTALNEIKFHNKEIKKMKIRQMINCGRRWVLNMRKNISKY